jgi:hypothetical protein
VESLCASGGLTISMKSTLSAYPGSVHWHFKQRLAAGTLEITLWPEGRRLWFSVHRRRAAPWIPGSIRRLRVAIERAL